MNAHEARNSSEPTDHLEAEHRSVQVLMISGKRD